MGRPICTAYLERNQVIAREYTESKKSLDELAGEYGLSKVRLRSILEAQGIELRPERRRSHFARRSKNNLLLAMAARLHFDRMNRGMSLTEYSILLGLSESRLSEALHGLYDWKFTEVVRAARVLGIELPDFIKPATGQGQ